MTFLSLELVSYGWWVLGAAVRGRTLTRFRACAGTERQTTGMAVGVATSAASANPLSQGHDDPLRPAHVGLAPDVLVPTDASDQAVAVRSQPVDRRLQVVDFE